MAFVRSGKKFDLIAMALVVDLAKDQFEEFPEGLGLLESLIARDVVVASPERKKQGIGCSGLELVEARTILVLLASAKLWQVRTSSMLTVPSLTTRR